MADLVSFVLLLGAILLISFYTPYPSPWMRWAVPIAIVLALALRFAPQVTHT